MSQKKAKLAKLAKLARKRVMDDDEDDVERYEDDDEKGCRLHHDSLVAALLLRLNLS